MEEKWEQSPPLGDPLSFPFDEPSEETQVPEMESDYLRRQGDEGLGTPEFEALHERILKQEEIEAYRREMDEKMKRKAEEILADLEHVEGWKMPRPLRDGLSVLMVVIAAILGMFLTTQAVQFAGDVSALSGLWRWLATAAMLVFGGVLATVFGALILGIFRLQRAPHVHPRALKILAERKRLQKFAVQKQEEARNLLSGYLESYPLEGKERRKLAALGMTPDELDLLEVSRDALLNPAKPVTADVWIDDFQRGFQAVIDRAANRRVGRFSRRVGIGTAASPIRFVDQMIVLYGCTALVKDMFTLYQLRPAFGQTLVILARSMIHTYLSGILEDVTEQAADATFDAGPDLAGDGLGALTGTIGKAISARAAEASLNGLLIWRLGKKTITLLQPVVTKTRD